MLSCIPMPNSWPSPQTCDTPVLVACQNLSKSQHNQVIGGISHQQLGHLQNPDPLHCIEGGHCHSQLLPPCGRRPDRARHPSLNSLGWSPSCRTHMQMHQLSPPLARITPGSRTVSELEALDVT